MSDGWKHGDMAGKRYRRLPSKSHSTYWLSSLSSLVAVQANSLLQERFQTTLTEWEWMPPGSTLQPHWSRCIWLGGWLRRLTAVLLLLFLDVDDIHWHALLLTEGAGHNRRNTYLRGWRRAVTREEEFFGLLGGLTEVGLTFLASQNRFVISIMCEDVHDINKLLQDGEARRHTSTCIFKREIEESIERDMLASVSNLLAAHAAGHLVAPVPHLLSKLTKGWSKKGEEIAGLFTLLSAAITSIFSSFEPKGIGWSHPNWRRPGQGLREFAFTGASISCGSQNCNAIDATETIFIFHLEVGWAWRLAIK